MILAVYHEFDELIDSRKTSQLLGVAGSLDATMRKKERRNDRAHNQWTVAPKLYNAYISLHV